ncbi:MULTISPECIES: CDP-glycerol glycerophosphotransferase family protein [Campylobacter]|uniref:CDP-glycerol glycerophosphotransferase family protein n=1 Tax=Campylobacter porcelli TaxID=1660073 RepID=A0A1X9SY00_9BACT|nr:MULTISPECIES: CDP-glycerol glycerophosphotransferase family protein [unclassified Campylobacter]ARR01157.1 hypothetical protein CSUIS_1365 [Campylobacter sp. RM6137]MCR8697145.1 CDP-glycerol glycerophosphotransferase family protein [Campylobacter sp. RM19073]MEE3705552.1 CDP-glycerol glycerophosphotransferase family protein [Campylobacter sp. CX2-8023-23]MEE3745258.1 CDP-glycerol glycerophosphotransferase family protein [Campylobacter sp. CX2-4855-23]
MQIKKYNRVFLFYKIKIFNFELIKEKIYIYIFKLKLLTLNKKYFNKFIFLKYFFKINNIYDNLYIKLFYILPFLKIECRDVPYEILNPKSNFFRLKHFNTLRKVRRKYKNNEKIVVLFFVSRISCFIWENLYKIFRENPIFNVKICVVPFCYTGKEEMIKYSTTAYEQLRKLGYDVIKAYNETTDTYLDIRKELKPDIIFHNKSWWKHLPQQYHLTNFPQSLNYLIEYGISGAKNPDGHFNLDSHWLCDTYFVPSIEHLKMAREISKIKGKNCVFLGYPKLDIFFDQNYQPKDVWKKQNKSKKKVIWAPHWLYDAATLYSTSTFAEIYDFMLYVADKYKDEIQFAFKPHPMLYKALQSRPVNGQKWTIKQINEYYQKWSTIENCQFENNRFEDLFLTSDAMIFDSISFMAEYMVTGKPALFTKGKKNILDFDEFGNKVYANLYHTFDLKKDIINFIEDIVLNENDYKKSDRAIFINNYLRSPNNKTSAKNIYEYITNLLKEN